jgi:hypothetical protein
MRFITSCRTQVQLLVAHSYIDRDMLQADIRKKTGLSRSSVYQLNKVRNEHKSKAIAYYLQSSLSDSYQV